MPVPERRGSGMPGNYPSKFHRPCPFPDAQVFLASTGVIGQRLPLPRMMKAVPSLVQSLSPYGLPAVAQAIMTTDTFPKLVSEEISRWKEKGPYRRYGQRGRHAAP